jgi:hypothetical protein
MVRAAVAGARAHPALVLDLPLPITYLKGNKRVIENQLASAALVRTRVRQEHVVRLV